MASGFRVISCKDTKEATGSNDIHLVAIVWLFNLFVFCSSAVVCAVPLIVYVVSIYVYPEHIRYALLGLMLSALAIGLFAITGGTMVALFAKHLYRWGVKNILDFKPKLHSFCKSFVPESDLACYLCFLEKRSTLLENLDKTFSL